MKFYREYGRYSSLSPVRTTLFERVSYADVILEVCRLFGRHSWSVFHFWRHYSSFSRIWTSILMHVPFGRHYSSVSHMWSLFLKFVAYLGINLEVFSILDVIFQVFRVFGHDSWSVSQHKIERERLTNIVHGGVYHTFTSIPYSYVYLMQLIVKAEKTC
jgi:hypothetical protein